MNKYTPGPWEVVNTGVDSTLEVKHREGALWYTVADVFLTEQGELEANARLIAAAPEMYEFVVKCAKVSCDCIIDYTQELLAGIPFACGPCRARAMLAKLEALTEAGPQ